METVRVAVIGVGNMGTAHAACLADGRVKGLTLAALADVNEQRRIFCRERFSGVHCYSSVKELLAAGGVDAVIVATPHPCHAAVAEQALKAGLHTLVEKPIDIALTSARHLCEVAEQSGKVFALMLNQRTNTLFCKARDIVKGGELGSLKRTVWIITNWYRTQHYYDSGAWRATWAGEGGGVLLNQAPHNLDLWQWICGMPVAVTAYCDVAKYHTIEVEDDVTILTRYANGATGVFITSTGESPGTNRLEITGDKGKLVLENGMLKWWKLRQSEREVCFSSDENFAQIPFDYQEFLHQGEDTAHRGILQNWANAILYGEALTSPGRDGLNELTLSNAAYLSQWTGNVSVALPMDCALFDRLLAERAAGSAFKAGAGQSATEGRYSQRWQVNW
ncbi:MAG: Gfo/Idh/MocA family oxidoreductase [Eubacteriales bacterium]|nr:Gfo/Idh/MocA family oxidoreductase [Eubacteriales bacterium]